MRVGKADFSDNTLARDRRQFFRLHFNQNFSFKSFAKGKIGDQLLAGPSGESRSTNVSQSGILFQTQNQPPDISSIVWMNLDTRTLSICKEIDRRALVLKEGLLGRVVRVEEDADNVTLYNVSVCFLTHDQRTSLETEQILKHLTQN